MVYDERSSCMMVQEPAVSGSVTAPTLVRASNARQRQAPIPISDEPQLSPRPISCGITYSTVQAICEPDVNIVHGSCDACFGGFQTVDTQLFHVTECHVNGVKTKKGRQRAVW